MENQWDGTVCVAVKYAFVWGGGGGELLVWGKGQIFSFRALGSDCDIRTVDFAIMLSVSFSSGLRE